MGNNESNMKNDLQKAEGKKMGKGTEKGRGGLVTDPKPISSELKENIAFIYMPFRKQNKRGIKQGREILGKDNITPTLKLKMEKEMGITFQF